MYDCFFYKFNEFFFDEFENVYSSLNNFVFNQEKTMVNMFLIKIT